MSKEAENLHKTLTSLRRRIAELESQLKAAREGFEEACARLAVTVNELDAAREEQGLLDKVSAFVRATIFNGTHPARRHLVITLEPDQRPRATWMSHARGKGQGCEAETLPALLRAILEVEDGYVRD